MAFVQTNIDDAMKEQARCVHSLAAHRLASRRLTPFVLILRQLREFGTNVRVGHLFPGLDGIPCTLLQGAGIAALRAELGAELKPEHDDVWLLRFCLSNSDADKRGALSQHVDMHSTLCLCFVLDDFFFLFVFLFFHLSCMCWRFLRTPALAVAAVRKTLEWREKNKDLLQLAKEGKPHPAEAKIREFIVSGAMRSPAFQH